MNLRELKAMQAQPDMEFSTRNLLSECWMLLMQELRETQPEDALPSAEGQERLRNMIAFIHTHYGEKLTLAQIAASAAVSEREALRCFRKYFHQSPFEYLNSFRLHQAKKMLIETNQTVIQISYQCGFSDSAYMGKLFRKSCGMTPLAYRKNKGSCSIG
ncbi:MAG: helix-turn-helix transcriptional regulator [Clostridiaceae bacterium]|nr:helix-turn-helix transcriptional regulator [Clostridiaceae bacterium]